MPSLDKKRKRKVRLVIILSYKGFPAAADKVNESSPIYDENSTEEELSAEEAAVTEANDTEYQRWDPNDDPDTFEVENAPDIEPEMGPLESSLPPYKTWYELNA